MRGSLSMGLVALTLLTAASLLAAEGPGRQGPGRQDPGRQDPGRRGPAGVAELALDEAALRNALLTPAPEISWVQAGQSLRLKVALERPLAITPAQLEIPVDLELGSRGLRIEATSGWRPYFDRLQGRWFIALVRLTGWSAAKSWEAENSPARIPIATRWNLPSLAPAEGSPADPSRTFPPLLAYLQDVRLKDRRVVLHFGFQSTPRSTAPIEEPVPRHPR